MFVLKSEQSRLQELVHLYHRLAETLVLYASNRSLRFAIPLISLELVQPVGSLRNSTFFKNFNRLTQDSWYGCTKRVPGRHYPSATVDQQRKAALRAESPNMFNRKLTA